MTKIEALVSLITDSGGSANWQVIYDNIEKYYPNAKNSASWQEGLRGVLYRGIKSGILKKIDTGVFALPDYNNVIVENIIFPDSAETTTCIEGAKITIQVNKYERNSIARQKCIDELGCYCHICGINFEKVYGEIGKDFIHVHHKIPLNEIKEEYVVDPIKDLLPVCPNCHAMLHRKIDGNYLTIDELNQIFTK